MKSDVNWKQLFVGIHLTDPLQMKGVKIRIKSNLLKSRFEEVYFICHSMSINSGENPRQNQNTPLTLIAVDGIAITCINIINLEIVPQLNPPLWWAFDVPPFLGE